ncbi:hypothetical protein Adt_22932 [Abeliophyllum distichum]|uniref:Uncharacterized protein n=1 Tax=Abeliophyllum distichum TaxID=126358 RepID=A0ABD1S9E8_9LAMI
MTDVMLHGCDGAGDPPHQPPHWLHSSCESASSSKQRGISRGINLGKTQVASSGASIDELAIVREVLGEHRGHIRGVGQAQLYRIERIIAHLTANLEQRLPGVVPSDDEEVGKDENDGRDLGDP